MDFKYVQAGGLRIRYAEQGRGATVVLLHGGLMTAEMWTGRMPMLAKHFHVLAPDTRGHGGTDNPSGRMRYDQFADDAMAFCAALGMEQPLIVGYSDGAQTAIEIGLRHPGKARALVIGGAMSELTPAFAARLNSMGFLAPGRVDHERLAAVFGEFYQALKTNHAVVYGTDYYDQFLAETAALWLSLPNYSDAQLAGIAERSLIIVGDRDGADGKEAVAQASRFYRVLPNAELAVIPNADHSAVEQDIFWTMVGDFLIRHA